MAVPRPREGSLRRGEIFGSALLQPARSVCVSSERFFSFAVVSLSEVYINASETSIKLFGSASGRICLKNALYYPVPTGFQKLESGTSLVWVSVGSPAAVSTSACHSARRHWPVTSMSTSSSAELSRRQPTPSQSSFCRSQLNIYFTLRGPGADLTGGHSCSGRRGPWEVGPWRPPDLGGPGRLNFGLQLQSPDCNLNGIYDLIKIETSTLIRRSVLSEF